MEEEAKGTVAPTSAVAHSPPATAREEGPFLFSAFWRPLPWAQPLAALCCFPSPRTSDPGLPVGI